jgi:hypothetical protein
VLAPEDLVVQALRAVIIAKVEARVLVLVLDYKLDPMFPDLGHMAFNWSGA